MKFTSAKCTAENCWWWAERMPETCRFLWQNKFWQLVHLVDYLKRNLLRCMVKRMYRWRCFDHPWWNHILPCKAKIVLVRQFLCPCFESPAAVFFLLDEIPSLKSADSVLLYVVTLPWLHWNMAWVFLQNFSIEDFGLNNVFLQKRKRQEQAQFIS
jgi:hypothetical protein